MTFNIGNQSGGVINNVAGHQTVYGGQSGSATSIDHARRAANDLVRGARDGGFASPDTRVAAERIRDEMRQSRPDQSKIAQWLERLTRGITAAGTWAKVGASVVVSIKTLAAWLGPLGATVIGLVPVL